jgi:3-dehydroquinate dehydratase / shikimate dehydrogenase
MKICSSIAARSVRDALTAARSVPPWVNLVEIRLDALPSPDASPFLRRPRPPVIITNRRKDEGGAFGGSAHDQMKILGDALTQGAEYVDAEFSWGTQFIKKLQSKAGKSSVICSYHNMATTPHDLPEIYGEMRRTGAPVLKIVTTATDITDNRLIFDILRRAGNDGQKLIACCMGERGQVSRILGGCFGSFLTYTFPSGSDATASGQIASDQLWELYRAADLNPRTSIFGLVGNPVKYSRGIYFHNARFAAKKANGVYVNFLVDKLPAFLDSFLPVVRGFSVTMPFKQQIVRYVTPSDPEIAGLGAINTVLRMGRRLIGHNTDYAALKLCLQKHKSIRSKKVLILGTGSMARTMAFAAIRLKASVTIAGRSEEKARILAGELGCNASSLIQASHARFDAVMNGTSVGMGASSGARILPPSFFRNNMLVVEAVYNPPETELLRDARRAGAKTITGVEIFERQAEIQSGLFIGAIQ